MQFEQVFVDMLKKKCSTPQNYDNHLKGRNPYQHGLAKAGHKKDYIKFLIKTIMVILHSP